MARVFPRFLTGDPLLVLEDACNLKNQSTRKLQLTSITRRMDLFDLPEECILHILEFLPLKGVIACSETCQRLRALMPSNMLWLPRLCDEYGLDLKVGRHRRYPLPLPERVHYQHWHS